MFTLITLALRLLSDPQGDAEACRALADQAQAARDLAVDEAAEHARAQTLADDWRAIAQAMGLPSSDQLGAFMDAAQAEREALAVLDRQHHERLLLIAVRLDSAHRTLCR